MFHWIFCPWAAADLWSNFWNIPEIFCTLDPGLRPGSNMQDIPVIIQEYSKNYFINQLLLLGGIFNDIFLFMQLFVMFLFHFYWNIPRQFCRLDHTLNVLYSFIVQGELLHMIPDFSNLGLLITLVRHKIFLTHPNGYDRHEDGKNNDFFKSLVLLSNKDENTNLQVAIKFFVLRYCLQVHEKCTIRSHISKSITSHHSINPCPF